MNSYFSGGRGGFDFNYYWDQFQPILGAIVIFIVGWILALIIAAGVKKALNAIGTNRRLSDATGHTPDYESLVSKFTFWFVLIIGVVAALNILNINSVSGPFSAMVTQVLVFIPNVISAIVVGCVGWIIGRLARTGISNLLARTELDEKLSSQVGVQPISENIADIIYWLILLLFLPIVLSILGLTGLLTPVQNMVNNVVGYLPNIFIAGVIAFVGYILAKIVRGIVEGLVKSFGLQAQVEKVGLFKSTSLGSVLGSFVFAIIIITSLIIAFEALGIEAISQPATAMLNQITYAIPNIIAAGLILIIAYAVSRFVANLVRDVLSGTGIDQVPEKLDVQRFMGDTKVSGVISTLIVFFTMLFAVSEASNRLGFDQISNLISVFIQFGASIILGAVILVIGFWLANVVASFVQRSQNNGSRWLGNLVRILIMGLVLAMGLRAMGIADSIVNLAFGLTLGSVAVAFALAFGLGGRQPAERVLTDLIDKAKSEGCNSAPKEHKAEQKESSVSEKNNEVNPYDPKNENPNG